MSLYVQFLTSMFLGLFVLAGEAEARRGAVPIPCTGDKIVKVADLPELRHSDGTKIDLGYRYSGCFSGEWVGYVGSSDRYLKLKPELLPLISATAGLGPVPSEPGFLAGAFGHPFQFWAEWFWSLIILFSALAMYAKSAAAVTPVHAPAAMRGEQVPARAKSVDAVVAVPYPAMSAAPAVHREPRMRDIARPNGPLRQSTGFGKRVR